MGLFHTPIFAFDFSMAKPAMASYINNHLDFYLWAANIDVKSNDILTKHEINVINRNLPKITELDLNEHSLIFEHVNRAANLAEMINDTISHILYRYGIVDKDNIIISNEGLAFSANGDATLDLSGYKYILMKTLMDAGFKKFNTYAPGTIKSIAGCSKKGMTGKDNMIMAIANEPADHPFCKVIRENPDELRKKTAFCMGVDDIADAYWCLKTTLVKENIECVLNGGK